MREKSDNKKIESVLAVLSERYGFSESITLEECYRANPYTVENMKYNAKKDEYTCPNERKLKFKRESTKIT